MNKVQDDDLDLFRVFETLRDGKNLIFLFITLAVLSGAAYIFFSTPVYESKIKIGINTTSSFYNLKTAPKDFKKKFYSESVFKEWKKENPTSISFEDFSIVREIDGYPMKNTKRLATFERKKKTPSYISINSLELSVLNDFYKYSNYINNSMIEDYTIKAKQELKLIEKRYKKILTSNKNIRKKESQKISVITSETTRFLDQAKEYIIFNRKKPKQAVIVDNLPLPVSNYIKKHWS